MADDFSHINNKDQPTMVDVGNKSNSVRTAHARSMITLTSELIKLLDNDEIQTKKGPVFQTAILAGIMACKQTPSLIPLCHPLALDKCNVEIQIVNEMDLQIDCTVKTTGKTGVEMEALTGAAVAALTIYDMCKSFSHDLVIRETKLMAKSGGKRDFRRE
jgi:cyclic pyranopterin phosphate synthase